MDIDMKVIIMTVREVVKSIYSLQSAECAHPVKGISSRQELEHEIKTKVTTESKLYSIIKLNDGEWVMIISKYADRNDGYDYYIPDTREREEILLGLKF